LALDKERKERLVSQYLELIKQSDAIFMTSYAGLNVKSMESLRKEVRDANGVLQVTKNTLLKLALEKADRPMPPDFLEGQLATGFAMDQAPRLAKALVDFAKGDENVVIKGGIMGDKFLSAAEIKALADLPTLDQLQAQIVGLITAPAQNILSVVTNGVRQVINVVDAYAKSEETAEAA
jgi:large subunit ribosomal protein L10